MAGLATFWIEHDSGGSLEAERIRVEQIVAIARHTPIVAAGNLINSLLMVVVFWGVAPNAVLVGWAALLWGFAVLPLRRWLIHRRRPKPAAVSRRAAGRAAGWAIAAGVLWGAAAAYLFPLASPVLQVFLAFVCGGMAAGAATSLATVPPAAVGYIAISMSPLIACFALAGGRLHLAMAAMLLLFAIMMVLTARNAYIRFLDTVRMAIARLSLLEQVESALRQAEAARATLLDAIASIGEAFCLFDPDDRLVLCNDRYHEAFAPIRDRIVPGVSYRRLCELCWDAGLVHEPSLTRDAWVEERVRLHLAAGPPTECRVGQDVWLWISERRTHDGGIATLVADITPLKASQIALEQARSELECRVEERTIELRAAKDEAERANAAKTRFLAAASHDLRQPLQAAILFQNLLALQIQDPDLAGVAARMGQALETQRSMLETLLDISRLDAGIVAPERQDFAVAEIIARLAAEFAPAAVARGLVLRVVPCRAVLHSDPPLVERILRNLLSNALRYTPSGRVLVGCRRRGDRIALQVWDTGIGIPADRITSIFEEFSQIHNEGRNRREGFGLGLAIVDRLARLLGHRVAVRSTPGRGSLFEIEVPRAAGEAALPADIVPAGPRAAAAGEVVAVIDDEPQLLEALRLFLEQAGYRAVVAVSAEEAIARLRGLGRAPDLILADYRLQGGMTGSAAIGRLRDAFAAAVPGILLTGDTSPDRLKEARQSGFLLLHKPIRPDDLFRALGGWR